VPYYRMDNMNPIFYVIAAAIIFLILKRFVFKHKPKDILVPTPTVERTDLKYTYFGVYDDGVAQTKDHINMLWECQFEGHIKAVDNILEAKMPTILDVQPRVMRKFQETGRNYEYNPNAVEDLRALFDYMKSRDALKYVVALVPIDEPNTNAKDVENLQKAIDAIKLVSTEYTELKDVKLCTIFAAKPTPFDLLDQFDWVGVDDYDSKSEIFVNGTYAELLKSKNPNFRTIIMPGGGWGQDPKPFENIAHTHPEVIAVVPFAYFTGKNKRDNWVGIGDDKNPMKQTYIALGKKLTGKS
jgi:hypothetical protein